jgi:diguanylate cyclase (GGDEF)-like protein
MAASPSSGPAHGVNRRRHPRIQIVHAATVIWSGERRVSCEILDYCRGGIYVHVDDALAFRIVAGQVGESVEVRFGRARRGPPADSSITGKVARITAAGLGISFEEQGAGDALAVLDAIAKSAPEARAARMPDIEQACRQALGGCAGDAVRLFAGRIQADLFRAADRARTGAEQSGYMDAIAIMKHADPLCAAYVERVKVQAEQYRVAIHTETDASGEDLSLVETDVFEDWLNLLAEITRLESAHEQSLRSLESRIARFSGRSINPKNNPYGPAALMAALRESLRGYALNVPAKKVIYGTFAAALRETLVPHYRQMDALTRALAPAAARPSVHPAARKGVTARTAIERAAAPAAKPPAAGPPLAGHALGSLGATFAALQQLSAGAVDAGELPVAVAGAPAHAANLLTEVMNDIQGNPQVHGELKPFFERWRRPLLEMAKAEPGLFDQPDHPVRRLLDALEQAALSATEAHGVDQGIRNYLEGWTEHLLQADPLDRADVERLSQAVEQLAAPLVKARNRRIERLRETCQGQQRMAEAHRQVERELDRRFGGISVPKVIVRLLQQGWRQWLLLTRLRCDDYDPEWVDSLEVLDELQTVLGPDQPLPEPADAHRIVKFIDDRLLPICQDRAMAVALMDELAELLLRGGEREMVWVEPSGAKADARPEHRLLRRVQGLAVGDWMKHMPAPGEPGKALRIAWIAPDHERFVLVDQRGTKQLDLGIHALVDLLDQERLEPAENLDQPLSERTVTGLIQRMQSNLRDQASCDAVTGLLNRKAFIRKLESENAGGPERAGHTLALLEMGELKAVFDVCGVTAAELALRQLAELVQGRLKAGEYAARVGDDRFALLYRDCDHEQATPRAERLLAELNRHPIVWQDRVFQAGAHLGLAAFVPGVHGPGESFNNADAACVHAGALGVNRIHSFRDGDSRLDTHAKALEWAGRIDRALHDHRLFSRCQEIRPVGDDDGAPSHYEILLGVLNDQGGQLPPAPFIAAAERWQRMPDVDRQQVEAVFHWIDRHPQQFAELGGFSVNLSGQSVNSIEFLQYLHGRLDAADFPLDKIIFEITETAAIAEFAQAETFIRQIRRYGCRFSLDDFGSGFSSYSYLKNLKVDYLKIDGSFIRELASSATDYAMVKSMTEIGHSLGLKIVAEYVESEAILAKLREIGVDYAQGYHVGKPRPLAELGGFAV